MFSFNIAEIAKVALFAFVAVVYLFVISKILGKKQIAELSFVDYVMGISIGSISAEMATDISEKPIYFYLVGMTVFLLVDVFITFLERKSQILKRFFKGSPEVLIEDGKILFKNLKKTNIDISDLLELCRDKGYFDISSIAFAIFETSGKMSILPNAEHRQTEISDISKAPQPKATLLEYLVIDGKICKQTLKKLDKEKLWLFAVLGINKKNIKQIALATYNKTTEKVEISKK